LHTINTNLWGDTGIFIDGVSISDLGCWARQDITTAGPRGRLRTVENPLIVMRDGVPVAASSTVGGGLFPRTLFSLISLLVYEMSPQQSVEDPAFMSPGFTPTRPIHRAYVGDFDADLVEEVRNRGFLIEELPYNSPLANPGWWIVLSMDPATSEKTGVTVDAWNGAAIAEQAYARWRRMSGRRLK
jgi:gamma-glutamyltranspeptidase/glutathione hydrolase